MSVRHHFPVVLKIRQVLFDECSKRVLPCWQPISPLGYIHEWFRGGNGSIRRLQLHCRLSYFSLKNKIQAAKII